MVQRMTAAVSGAAVSGRGVDDAKPSKRAVVACTR